MEIFCVPDPDESGFKNVFPNQKTYWVAEE